MTSHGPFSRTRAFVLANTLLAVYWFGVAISMVIAIVIGRYTFDFTPGQHFYRTLLCYGSYYDVPVAILSIVIIVFYEQPIRRLIKDLALGRKSDASLLLIARRRLLNEPFVLVLLNLSTWIGAAGVYHLLARRMLLTPEMATLLVVASLLTAVISVLITFFFLQFGIQRWMAPLLFPRGGLASVPGTLRITLATRLGALIAAVCLAPFLIIGVTLNGAEHRRLYGLHPEEVLDKLAVTLTIELILFSVLAVAVTYLVASNLSRPFGHIIHVLHQIKVGRFNQRVQVVTNDELGYAGDAINEMSRGLMERERLQRSLNLAREVQQSLLPLKAPRIPGLDIAGKSLYCDETGGDYYDFMEIGHDGSRRLVAVIGDVSGHGISSALLMTSIRALVRFRAPLPGRADEVVQDLNRQFCLDTAESGQFLTLFYLVADPRTRVLEWVRAGHEPAYLYQPDRDRFEILNGPGAALGLDEAMDYSLNRASAAPGDILVLTTDGVFEARRRGEMFGRQRFMDVVRRRRHLPAAGIRDAILQAIGDFRGSTAREDDVTLMVIKFDETAPDSA